MTELETYLAFLRSLPVEIPIEPELKHDRKEKDRQIKEEQDLAAGAVMEAQLCPGTGTSSPGTGDLVFIHYSILDGGEVLYSTRSDENGSGQPLAFQMEKGVRAPRSWEIVLKGMTAGERRKLKVKPEYGYMHPDCQMQPPPGVSKRQATEFDIELLSFKLAGKVRGFGPDGDYFKVTVVEGQGWETARPPFEVTVHLCARLLAYDGLPCSGFQYFSTHSGAPLSAVLGQGLLPEGVEVALSSMSREEEAAFVVPASAMTGGPASLVPAPPAGRRPTQVELEIKMLSMVQVRDVYGDASVLKRRLRAGQGEFPVDCPLNDTAVKVQYRVRRARPAVGAASGPAEEWVYDTRTRGGKEGQPPLELDTGCGELPEGLEATVKLMVTGEVASVACASRHAYATRADCPPGLRAEDDVEFEVELVSFEREGYWQSMEMDERLQLAGKMKDKGNELYKQGKYQYARARYERLSRLLDSTRDFESQEEVDAVDALKVAAANNLALCCTQLNDYAAAVEWCSRVLEHDPDNGKALLRRGRAHSLRGAYADADADLATAAEADPTLAAEVEAARSANAKRQRTAEQKQRREMKNFFDR